MKDQGRRKLFCGGGLSSNAGHHEWSTKKKIKIKLDKTQKQW